jgi:hypothetical protein
MKALVLFLFFAGLAAVHGDDLLQNGDFSDGLAHWSGDAEALANSSVDNPPPGNGIVVRLHDRDWSRVCQDFQVNAGTYKLHVTFTLSPGLHFSDRYTDYIELPTKLNFPDKHPIDGEPGQWLIVVSDSNAGDSLTWTVSPSRPSGSQSYTFTIQGIDFDHKQTLTLFFPPGAGFVTLQHVALVPADGP